MKRSRLKPISSKRAKDMVKYRKVRKEYLRAYPICEICGSLPSTEIHHMKGRIGELLYNMKFFKAVDRMCHEKLGAYPAWARKNEYSLDRLTPFTNI